MPSPGREPTRAAAGRFSANAESDEQVAARRLIERLEVEGAIALVAQELEECWAAFFLGGLNLTVIDTHQVHLQGLNQEVLGIPAIRTRQRQVTTPCGPLAEDECISGFSIRVQDLDPHGATGPRGAHGARVELSLYPV